MIIEMSMALGLALAAQSQEGHPATARAAQEEAAQREAEELFPDEMEEFQAELADEMAEAFAIFGEVFKADPLTAEQQARLPAAQAMTDYAFPEGTFAVVMEQSMKPMMDAVLTATMPNTTASVAEVTGLTIDQLSDVDEAALVQALEVFDAQYEERGKAMSDLVLGLMGQMFAAIEPAYREGLSRAFATRFDQSEMDSLLVFFETDVGAKFAKEAFLVQYDPQLMGVMEQMGPAIAEVMPAFMTSLMEFAEEYPDPRTYGELSQAERSQVARLLGRSEQELEAVQPAEEEIVEEPLSADQV